MSSSEYREEGNVHFMGVMRMADKLLLAQASTSKRGVKADQVKTVLGNQKLGLKPEQIYHWASDLMGWHVVLDRKGLIFITVTEDIYPQRTANACLAELQQEFNPTFGAKCLEAKGAADLGGRANDVLKKVAKKYDRLDQVDKLVAVKRKVDKVADVMADNTRQALENLPELGKIHAAAEKAAGNATMFRKAPTNLNRQREWNRTKKRILMALLLLVVIAAIVAPVVIHKEDIQAWGQKLRGKHAGSTAEGGQAGGGQTEGGIPQAAQ